MSVGLAQLRTDLVALLAPIVTGGGEVAPYMPDAVNVFPSIWLGDSRAKVSQAMQFRTWTFTMPITVAVARKAVYAEERAASAGLLDAVVDRIDSDFSLGGTTFGLEIVEFVEGAIGPIAGEELVGFTVFLNVKYKPAFTG